MSDSDSDYSSRRKKKPQRASFSQLLNRAGSSIHKSSSQKAPDFQFFKRDKKGRFLKKNEWGDSDDDEQFQAPQAVSGPGGDNSEVDYTALTEEEAKEYDNDTVLAIRGFEAALKTPNKASKATATLIDNLKKLGKKKEEKKDDEEQAE